MIAWQTKYEAARQHMEDQNERLIQSDLIDRERIRAMAELTLKNENLAEEAAQREQAAALSKQREEEERAKLEQENQTMKTKLRETLSANSERRFRAADINHDQTLSFTEWKAAFGVLQGEEIDDVNLRKVCFDSRRLNICAPAFYDCVLMLELNLSSYSMTWT